MEIKVLGTGCSKCQALHKTVLQAVESLGIKAEVIKEEDLTQIMKYNVMMLPALVVNEKVVATGKIALPEVKEILTKCSEA